LLHSLVVISPEGQEIQIATNVDPIKTLLLRLSQHLLRIVQPVQHDVLEGQVAVSCRCRREPLRLFRFDDRLFVPPQLLVNDTEI
jgi:hypothetical protein